MTTCRDVGRSLAVARRFARAKSHGWFKWIVTELSRRRREEQGGDSSSMKDHGHWIFVHPTIPSGAHVQVLHPSPFGKD